jgi:Tfp pilus assembly protein PilV
MWRAGISRPGTGRPGVTLIETLISTVLFTIVMAGVYAVYTTMQETLVRGEIKSDLQQNARIGLARMASEIRMAGTDPSNVLPLATPEPRAAIRAASATCLSFIAPDELGATKQITYDLNGTVLRRNEQPWVSASNPEPNNTFAGGAGAQPIAEAVNVLRFTYYDQYNKVISPGAWLSKHRCPPAKDNATVGSEVQLTYWQMRAIRRISIVLQTRSAASAQFQATPDWRRLATESFTLSTDVRLRNR